MTEIPTVPDTPPAVPRAARFTYGPLEIDEAAGVLRCHYDLDGRALTETVTVGPGLPWTPAAREAARLVHLLAGISYYKAGAPPVVDLGATAVRAGAREFLRDFYIDGLGEFAYRNHLDLTGLDITGGTPLSDTPTATATPDQPGASAPGDVPPALPVDRDRPLIPFGGGIDSIVTVEAAKQVWPDAALFVLNRAGVARFEAIDRAAAATGLPVVRAEREIDGWILAPDTRVLNGHVPITGILSAIAVLCATLTGRGRVIMSNEWSASRPNLVAGGRSVNHQWSKSLDFEDRFRTVVAAALGPEAAPDYFSFLRPFSELWVAQRFAHLTGYHRVVHSCNRAFHLDPAKRLDYWCGECDKCCFIDLILAPFMDRADLAAIFAGREPLERADLLDRFRALVGAGDARKPFECVGDLDECRTAAALAAARPDRAGNTVLAALVTEAGSGSAAGTLLRPLGPHHLPSELAAALG